jgi:serine/threonine-protein kinase
MTTDIPRREDKSLDEVGPGSRIASYLIEEQIGRGGMAVVFRARDEVLERTAAVKIIAPSRANDEQFRARFLRESRIAANIDSPHIIPVYAAGQIPFCAAGQDEELLYIAMRYVPGGDLAALLRGADGTLAPARAGALVAQVASALDAAHAADLVHRDVKPQNILVDTGPERPDHAFLSDFGLSKRTKSSSVKLTGAGQFLGTPDFAAPEQVKGEHVDGRTDQYALACVAFLLLTGTLPFERDEALATMYAHLKEPVPSLARLRPELPEAVDAVIARGLAKAAGERYDKCGDFAAALREALAPAAAPAAPALALAVPAPAASAPANPPAPVPAPVLPAATAAPAQAASAPRANVPAVPAQAGQARDLDPWAWLARKDGAGRVPVGQPVWRPPTASPRLPSGVPSPSPAAPSADGSRPEQGATWQNLGLSPALTAGWEAAIRENAAYTKVVTRKRRTGGWRRRRGRRFHLALIGGAAAAALAVGGSLYALNLPGGSASSASQRPGEPKLAETLTVPGNGTIDAAWVSPDGKFIAASGQGPAIYVWNTADPGKVLTTITPPTMKIGRTDYSTVADNLAFSADDSTLTGVVHPNVPSGAPLPGGRSSYDVYQWNLATGGKPKLLRYPVQTPTYVTFSGDNGMAMTSQGNKVTLVTLARGLPATPAATLAGVPDQKYVLPFELDRRGDRMIYHPASDETYVWDFRRKSVIAKLKTSEYTVLSPDGKTILAASPTDYPASSGSSGQAAPMLWDVATRSNVTPTDPRWKQQLRQSWQAYARDTYSTDGSVLATERAGGKIDLWSTVTRKHLLTITDPGYRKGGQVIVGPGGSEVLVLASGKTAFGQEEYRQIRVWETPLSPPRAP